MENDEFKDIPGFDGYKISEDGKVWSDKRNVLIKNKIDKSGNHSVCIYKNGKQSVEHISRLLHITFGISSDGARNKPLTERQIPSYRYSANIGFVKGHHCGRPIMCVETGERFCSIAEAAYKKDMQGSNISMVLSGKIKRARGLTFKYLEENTDGN